MGGEPSDIYLIPTSFVYASLGSLELGVCASEIGACRAEAIATPKSERFAIGPNCDVLILCVTVFSP